MPNPNRYPGKCYVCGKPVEANAGYYVKGSGTLHLGCYRPRRPGGRPYLSRDERLSDWIDKGERDAQTRKAFSDAAQAKYADLFTCVLLAPR